MYATYSDAETGASGARFVFYSNPVKWLYFKEKILMHPKYVGCLHKIRIIEFTSLFIISGARFVISSKIFNESMVSVSVIYSEFGDMLPAVQVSLRIGDMTR